MPPRAGYPGFLALCDKRARRRRRWCRTATDKSPPTMASISNAMARRCVRWSRRCIALGCRVSLFADAGCAVEAAAATGADRIELYTGPFAAAFATGDAAPALAACADSARRAARAGLGVNAGHDLSQTNLGAFLAAVAGVAEVSIGHALVDEALYAGWTRPCAPTCASSRTPEASARRCDGVDAGGARRRQGGDETLVIAVVVAAQHQLQVGVAGDGGPQRRIQRVAVHGRASSQ